MLTRQEIFEKAARRLLTQNVKSGVQNEDGAFECRYRGPNGTMYAAGPFIHPDDYQESFENTTIDSRVFDGFKIPLREVADKDRDLVRALQVVHDDYEPNEWRVELNALGKALGLTWPADL